MTVALALIFVGTLLIYTGIKGRSLKDAVLGHAVAGGTGSIVSTS